MESCIQIKKGNRREILVLRKVLGIFYLYKEKLLLLMNIMIIPYRKILVVLNNIQVRGYFNIYKKSRLTASILYGVYRGYIQEFRASYSYRI